MDVVLIGGGARACVSGVCQVQWPFFFEVEVEISRVL